MSHQDNRTHTEIINQYEQARTRAEKSNRPVVLTFYIRRGQPPIGFTGSIQYGNDKTEGTKNDNPT